MFKVTKDRVPELVKAMEAFAHKEVLVGIPSDSAKNDRDDAPITNAQIGYINEFGAPEMNIPARPFLVPGVEKAWPEAQRYMAKAAEKVLKFTPDPMGTVNQALEGAGLLAQGEVVQMINDGLSPALSETTLAMREAKGFYGTKPLIHTGSLKQSITYVVDDAERK
jgi:hypothetical protein